jgi:hypothetical protein
MRRCIAISAAVMFLAQVSYARPSGEQSSGQELLQRVKQALKAPGKAWAGTVVSGKAVRGGVEHAYSFLPTLLMTSWLSADLHAAGDPTIHAIYKSTDQGRSWSRSDSGLPGDSRVNALTTSGKAVFAGTDSGLFVSRDAGRSWAAVPGTAKDLGRVVGFASLAQTLFAGTRGSGVFASTDEGKTWKPVNEGLADRSVRSLLSWRRTLYAGTDTAGVFRSLDGGRTWSRFDQGIPPGAQVFALAGVGDSVFAGLYSKGLYRRDDRRRSWVKVGSVAPLVLASIGETLVAGQNPGGLHWSTDLGATWSAGGGKGLSANAPVWDLASDHRKVFAGALEGIYSSDDRGRTWSRAETGLPGVSPGISFLVTEHFVLAATILRKSPQ